ncbi:MAG: glycine--tRNA ligase, partial [Candidatus Shikimatogenerans sp. JK-2022]|nr:glycine--tRNA ligase [Candidatus Shikimatogenerans bostrichidophilus]
KKLKEKKILKLLNNKKINKIYSILKLKIKKYKLFNYLNIKKINLMFSTLINSFKEKKKKIYLRPETAQGIFLNFNNLKNFNKLHIPFGIAQIGKVFRNEIITKQFIFRTKEFEQMEMEFFIEPGTEKKWFKYWLKERFIWHKFLKLGKKNYKFKKHQKLSHYSKYAVDIEFNYINKFKELEGIHFRKDYDLKNHQLKSKKKLFFFNKKKNKKYIPYVIETSLGLDRVFFSILSKSFKIQKLKNNIKRIYLKLPKFIAPIKIAVFPLIKNNINIIQIAKKIYINLKFIFFDVIFDDKGSIGKRYRIQDSIGTPYCVTIDKISIKKKTVTIRNRDNMLQKRYKIKFLYKYFKNKFNVIKILKKINKDYV